MLRNFLGKKKRAAREEKMANKPLKELNWRLILAFPIWTLAAFIGGNLVVVALLYVVRLFGVDVETLGSPAVVQSVMAVLIYLSAFLIAFGVPYALGRRRVTLETLGLQRLMSWTDIGLAPVTFIVYLLASSIFISLVVALIPSFPIDQAQDVGFKNITNQTGYLVAFFTLVVAAPIAEEALFRGYLYGKLRGHAPFWISAVLTSMLFGAVHMQWNVALDTFVLSLFLCGLREITGSIWAGILLHMVKNMIAFYILFMSPLFMGGIGG